MGAGRLLAEDAHATGRRSGYGARRQRAPKMLCAPSPRTPPPRPGSGSRLPAAHRLRDWFRAGEGARSPWLLASGRAHRPPSALRLVDGRARHRTARLLGAAPRGSSPSLFDV